MANKVQPQQCSEKQFLHVTCHYCASHMSRLEVRVNDPNGKAHFRTNVFGGGNVIARHGIHGYQWNYEVPIEGALLFEGDNTIYLTQSKGGFQFIGFMYDYLRFEGPCDA